MATCARSHGGDGGDRPPHGHPPRISSGCKSSQPRRRGVGADKNLQLARKNNNNKPLPVEFDIAGGTYKVVGDYQSMFVRCITNGLPKLVHFHYFKWEHVPEEEKKKVFRLLKYYFDLTPWTNSDHWDLINEGINNDINDRFRALKNKFACHFKKVGGRDDLENAKKKPHYLIGNEKWKKLIDGLFVNPEYIKLSEQNSKNRAKQLYPSCGGSRPYAQTRHLDLKSTGKSSEIENWRSMHYNSKSGWVNKRASQDWDKIEDELNKMQMEAGDDNPVDEVECLKRALGERRGWERGIGRKVKRPSSNVASVYEPTPSQWEIVQQQLKELTDRLNRMDKNNGQTSKDVGTQDMDEDNEDTDVEDEGSD